MSDADAQAEAGTAESQGPVKIDEELARHVENKRDELLEKFEIPDAFPPEVLEEAEAVSEDIQAQVEAELDERRDLRDLTTWTTDPVDAQDFDDAISVQERADEYVLWVHIADVTHYVTPETSMWDAAVERANTVYLPGYTIHMLPPVLAETACSLIPDEDRLAHTVEMHLDKDDLSYETIDIYKSVIRSDARLTYTECEHVLDDPDAVEDILGPTDLDLHEKSVLVHELADRMHEQRKEDGSLVLNPRRDRAHTIIEESMLKANKAVTHELMWNR
ncbi:MAG: RNB domain-containing ribonuclease, partial [Halobacteriales archaeon]